MEEKEEIKEYKHPRSGAVIRGRRLGKGDVIKNGDFFYSYETWKPCKTVGFTLKSKKQKDDCVFIRPAT